MTTDKEPKLVTSLQCRVASWMQACFGPEVSADKLERGDRFLEETLELLQSGGYPPERVVPLRDYVFNREVGDPSQEVGGVMITLAAYCLAHGLDMHEAGEAELARVWTKVDKIRAKQAAKPVGSALPVALAPATPGPWEIDMTQTADDETLYKAAVNAAATIGAIYEWLERVEKAGGTTSISGVASCHAMLTSLRKNADRTDKLVMKPLRDAIAARESRVQS